MKEKLISFRLAKLAKKKGFDIPVNNFYWKNESHLDNGDGDTEFVCLNHNEHKDYYSTTSQSLLQGWLRNKHGRHIQITSEFYKDGIIWNVQVLWWDKENTYDYKNGTGMYGDNGEYVTYEAALEKGLELALESI